MNRMTRRKFIKAILIITVVVLLNVFLFVNFNYIVKQTIKRRLSYLNFNSDSLEKFIADADAKNLWDMHFGYRNKKLFIKAHFFIDNPLFSLPYKHKYEEYSDFIVSRFLLSTDFFYNKMNTDREIKYLALHEPYFRPCSNPFSNLYY